MKPGVNYVASTVVEDADVAKKGGRRPEQLQQVWMKADDVKNFEKVARLLHEQGIDVKFNGHYSLSKVVRYLLAQKAREAVDNT